MTRYIGNEPAASPVTGDQLSATVITGQTEDTAPDKEADYILVYDASGAVLKKVLIGRAAGPVSATVQASTSGTSIDFTSIPSWVKKVTVLLAGVSTNGAASGLIQIGDSGGIENTNYLGASGLFQNAGASSVSNFTTGFGLFSAGAVNVLHGAVHLYLVDAATNTWVAAGELGFSNGTFITVTGGSKSLSGTLDRVRLTTTNGTDTFDAGLINILFE